MLFPLALLLLCLQVQVYHSPTRNITTNPVDAGLLGFPVQVYKVKRFVIVGYYHLRWWFKSFKTTPKNMNIPLRWNQLVFRKGRTLSIRTPWWLGPKMGYALVAILVAVVSIVLLQGYQWQHLAAPAAIGMTAWNDGNTQASPTSEDMDGAGTDLVTGDTVSITKVLVINKSCGCGNLTAPTLTINVTFTLTMDAGSSLTTTNACTVSGILVCGNATVSCTGVGASNFALSVSGTFFGGSGGHIVQSFNIANGSNITFTSGTMFLTGTESGATYDALRFTTPAAFDDGNGTVSFTLLNVNQTMFDSANIARTLYNVTINKGTGGVLYTAGKSFPLTVANSLNIITGNFSAWDGTTSASLTVQNNTTISGTLDCKASTASLGSGYTAGFAVLINNGGILTGGTGANHTYGSVNLLGGGTWIATSGTTFINGNNAGNDTILWGSTGVFTHSNGTLSISYTAGASYLEMFADINVYNLIINNTGRVAYLWYNHTLTVSNNLTLAAGALDTNSIYNAPIIVMNATSITGALVPNTSTCTFNGAVTINSGGALGGNAAWTFIHVELVIYSGGTLSAPNSGGSWTWVNGGFTVYSGCTLTHNGGTSIWNSGGYLGGSGSPVFYNVTGGTSGPAPNISFTVEHTLTTSGAGLYPAYGASANVIIIMGTASAAGSIVNSTNIRAAYGVGSSFTVQAASASYPCVCTGNDWDWDCGGAKTISVKWLDYQIAAVTGGGGCTVNWAGTMSTRSWTVSVGDSLTMTDGVAITGVSVAATKYINLGTWTWGTCSISLVDLQWDTVTPGTGKTITFTNIGVDGFTVSANDTISMSTGTVTCNPAKDVIITGNSAITGGTWSGYRSFQMNNATAQPIVNTTLTGTNGSAWNDGMDITINTGKAGELSGCTLTYSKVGMQATNGSLYSLSSGNATVMGILSSESNGVGYRAANITGVLTVRNADVYSSAFNTAYTLGANLPATSITLAASTTLAAAGYSLSASTITGASYTTSILSTAVLVSSCTVSTLDSQVSITTAGGGITALLNGIGLDAIAVGALDTVILTGYVTPSGAFSVAVGGNLVINVNVCARFSVACTCAGTLTVDGVLQMDNSAGVNSTGSHIGTIDGDGVVQGVGSSAPTMYFHVLALDASVRMLNATLVVDLVGPAQAPVDGFSLEMTTVAEFELEMQS